MTPRTSRITPRCCLTLALARSTRAGPELTAAICCLCGRSNSWRNPSTPPGWLCAGIPRSSPIRSGPTAILMDIFPSPEPPSPMASVRMEVRANSRGLTGRVSAWARWARRGLISILRFPLTANKSRRRGVAISSSRISRGA